jgi:hypothetical protein
MDVCGMILTIYAEILLMYASFKKIVPAVVIQMADHVFGMKRKVL